MSRALLAQRRPSEAFGFEHAGHRFRIQVGFYSGSGTIGEVFVNAEKTDSAIDALGGDVAILISLLLQHGAMPAAIGHALRRNPNGERASLIGALVDALAARYPAEDPAPALETEALGESDPRVDIAYQALKDAGHLVGKPALALALSRVIGNGAAP